MFRIELIRTQRLLVDQWIGPGKVGDRRGVEFPIWKNC